MPAVSVGLKVSGRLGTESLVTKPVVGGRVLVRPDLPTPKRSLAKESRSTGSYTYYAGFSVAFASGALERMGLRRASVLLDPWVGSGTTTRVAQAAGHETIGTDINPAMLLVARAQQAPELPKSRYRLVGTEILRRARGGQSKEIDKKDPLSTWLAPASARAFRSLDEAIRRSVLGNSSACLDYSVIGRYPHELAVSYVALFRTLRRLLIGFFASNPTWVKAPSKPAARLRPSSDLIFNVFRAELGTVIDRIEPTPLRIAPATSHLILANSTRLPLKDNSVDAVLGSPPYCTRIDYAMATRLELAALSFSDEAFRALRDEAIGTPTVVSPPRTSPSDWGPSCRALLQAISGHRSKASSSYYRKVFSQYFDGLQRSLLEIARVAKPRAPVLVVVQDSFYKDVHVDLQGIVIDMTSLLGWTLHRRDDFLLPRTMAALNPRHRRYRGNSEATESVLQFYSAPGGRA